MYKKNTHQDGFAALFTVVVIAAAVLLLSRGSAMIGLGELDLGVTYQHGQEALYIADGCMEEVFQRIRMSSAYSGEATLTVPNGSCDITVVDPAPTSNTRVVTITGTSENYYKTIEAEITLSGDPIPTIDIISWREVDS